MVVILGSAAVNDIDVIVSLPSATSATVVTLSLILMSMFMLFQYLNMYVEKVGRKLTFVLCIASGCLFACVCVLMGECVLCVMGIRCVMRNSK